MTGWPAELATLRAELAGLRAELAALRTAFDCASPGEVEAEMRRPSPLGPSSCLAVVPRPEPRPLKRGATAVMRVNGTPTRFHVLCDPYEVDGELVVDLRGSQSGVVLEGVPVADAAYRPWAESPWSGA